MLIFKDFNTGHELCSDSFKHIDESDGLLIRISAKMVTIKDENNFDIGANASAEGEDDDGPMDENARQVLDVAETLRLKEQAYDKKSYVNHMKEYMKATKERLEKENPGRVDAFQKGAQEFVKKIVGSFGDWCFYHNTDYIDDGCDKLGMPIPVLWNDDGKSAEFYFWKDALVEEKV
eukprot:TRINITY_DN78299_c0_g1_i1.p1 TRINITY_DN78299_c0_g1~~TRINITY_DN78299_c0_g1_i1.p1  ORF type:complete len:177 (+),score=41.62 TRINITY_DN78299_c0_g1_i1:46-576(+)